MPLSSSSLFPILSSPQICFTSSLHWSLNSPIMDFGIAKTFARLVLETTDFDNLYLFDFTSYTIWESSPIELNFSENLQLTRLDFLPISFPRLRFLFSNSISSFLMSSRYHKLLSISVFIHFTTYFSSIILFILARFAFCLSRLVAITSHHTLILFILYIS